MAILSESRAPTECAYLISAHGDLVCRTCSSFLFEPRLHRHLPKHTCDDSRSSLSCRPHRKHWHPGLRSENSKTAGGAGRIAMRPAHHAPALCARIRMGSSTCQPGSAGGCALAAASAGRLAGGLQRSPELRSVLGRAGGPPRAAERSGSKTPVLCPGKIVGCLRQPIEVL